MWVWKGTWPQEGLKLAYDSYWDRASLGSNSEIFAKMWILGESAHLRPKSTLIFCK